MRTWRIGVLALTVASAALFGFGCSSGSRGGAQTRKEEPIPKSKPAPPVNAQTYFAYANLLERQGSFEGAAAHYRKAIEAKPDFLAARNRLGITLNKLGKNSDAVSAFREALAQHPEQAHLHNNLGFSLLLNGNFAEAESATHRALELKPDFRRARLNHGIALAKLRRFDEAHTEFKAVCSPDDAAYNLAMVQADAGLYHDAIQTLQGALAQNPSFEPARQEIERLARLDRPAAPPSGPTLSTPTAVAADVQVPTSPALRGAEPPAQAIDTPTPAAPPADASATPGGQMPVADGVSAGQAPASSGQSEADAGVISRASAPAPAIQTAPHDFEFPGSAGAAAIAEHADPVSQDAAAPPHVEFELASWTSPESLDRASAPPAEADVAYATDRRAAGEPIAAAANDEHSFFDDLSAEEAAAAEPALAEYATDAAIGFDDLARLAAELAAPFGLVPWMAAHGSVEPAAPVESDASRADEAAQDAPAPAPSGLEMSVNVLLMVGADLLSYGHELLAYSNDVLTYSNDLLAFGYDALRREMFQPVTRIADAAPAGAR